MDRGSSLVLERLQPADVLHGVPSRLPWACARPHPSEPGRVSIVDAFGTLHAVRSASESGASFIVATYELQLASAAGYAQPVCKPWRLFEHCDEDGVILAHAGSKQLLFAQLPLLEGDRGSVFLFGAHEAEVLSIAKTERYMASGSADGCVKMWALDSGQMTDSKLQPGGSAVTALAFAGPLMVVAGTQHGSVCIYDISSGLLQAVQRFVADEGPVTALACCLTPQLRYNTATAEAPRGFDGGGLVEGPMGLPWRASAGSQRLSEVTALVAVGSSAGWLHIYRGSGTGEQAWSRQYSGTVAGTPHVSFSHEGMYMALAGAGYPPGQLTVLDTTTFQAVQQYMVQGPLAAAGFMPPGGSALVVLPRSLSAGLRLELYAAPSRDLPCTMQLVVPLHPEQQQSEPDAFLAGIRELASAPMPSVTLEQVTKPSPLRGMWNPTGAPTASAPATSPLAPTREARASTMTAPWVSPHSSPRQQLAAGAAATGAAAGPGPSSPGAGAAFWQAIRPSTLPAPRSWVTGIKPRLDLDLPMDSGTAAPKPGSATSGAPSAAARPGTAAARAPGGTSPRAPPQAQDYEDGGSGLPGDVEHDFGLLGLEAELPNTGTLLPATGIPAVPTAGNRYSRITEDDDHDLQPRSLRKPAAAAAGFMDRSAVGRTSAQAGAWQAAVAASSAEAEAEEEDVLGERGYSGDEGDQTATGVGPATWRWSDIEMTEGTFGAPAGQASAHRHGLDAFRFEPLPGAQLDPEAGGAQGGLDATAALQSVAARSSGAGIRASQSFAAGHSGYYDANAAKDTAREDVAGFGSDDARAAVEDGGRNSVLERAAYFGNELRRLSASGQEDDVSSPRQEQEAAGGGAAEDEPPLRASQEFVRLAPPQQEQQQSGSDTAGPWSGQEALQPQGNSGSTAHSSPASRAWQASRLPAQQADPEDEDEEEDGQQASRPSYRVGADSAAMAETGRVASAADSQEGQPEDAQQQGPGGWLNSDVLMGSTTFRTPAKEAPRPLLHARPAPRQPSHTTHRIEVTQPAAAAGAAGAARQPAAGPVPAPRPKPALVFRGFKPSHEKLMKQLRQAAASNVEETSAGAPAGGAVPGPGQRHGAGRGGAGGQSSAAMQASEDASPLHSLLQSPAVRMGSPRDSATPAGSTAPSQPHTATRVHQQQQSASGWGLGPSQLNPADAAQAMYQRRQAAAAEYPAAAAAEAGGDAGGQQPPRGSPPRAPQIGTSLLLLRKMQALEQVVRGEGQMAEPQPSALGAMQLEEAARRAATAAANVPPGAQLYYDLPPVECQPAPPPKLTKQLHPGWVASRQAKPELTSLWRAEDFTTEVCNTRGVALYSRPTVVDIARGLMQWL